MRGSRNVCLESGLLSALQRFCHWNGVSLAGRLCPTLNADFVALRVLVGLRTSIAKEPYSIVISHGSAPLPLWKRAWMYSNPENFTLIDDIPSMWHSSTNKSHVSNIYGSRGGNGVLDTLHTQANTHTHMRARVLADHRDVGLLRNTDIDPLPLPPPLPPPPPPPPPTIQKDVQPAFFRPPAKHLVPSPWSNKGSAYAIILTLQFVNGCSLFKNKRVVQEIICWEMCSLYKGLKFCAHPAPSKMLYANVNFSKWLT